MIDEISRLREPSFYNSTVLASDHTANGSKAILTAGADLAMGQVCYMGSDGKMELAKGDAAATMPAFAICLATIAENATGLFLIRGYVRDDSWSFDVGSPVYVSAATAGLVTKTAPAGSGNQVQKLGMAITATIVLFDPDSTVVELA